MTKKLEKQISNWRSNYQQYAADNLYIINKDAQTVPLVFNKMQRTMWQLLLKQLKEGKPIRWLVIKDRQLGFTTFVCGLFFWISTLFPNKSSLHISYDIDSAAGIFNKDKLFYKMLHPALRPQRKISNRRELYFANPDDTGELGLESRIVIDTADSKDIGASYTLQLVHWSELAICESMGLDIKTRMAALKQAIPERPGTIFIIETTPRGDGYVSNAWDSGIYTNIFISSVADETYRIELKPEEYFELSDYEEHKYGDETVEYELYENEVKFWYPELTDPIKIQHEVMCRLAWRREVIDKKCEGDREIFDREYPITIEKAFATSGSHIFNIPKIKQIKKKLNESNLNFSRYRFDKDANDFYVASGGPLKIFSPPLSKFKYIAGVDVALGASKDGDNSAISIRRIPDLLQCATYQSVIDPHEFAILLYNILVIYNNAFAGIEVNERGGYAVVDKLINGLMINGHLRNYRNLYLREVMLEPNRPKTKKYGWSSNPKTTKPTMESDYKAAINNDEIEIVDIEILNQLEKYILYTNNNSILTGVKPPGHDDLAIADMICLQMAKYVHMSEEKPKVSKKYSFEWWANTLNQYDVDVIGYSPKG